MKRFIPVVFLVIGLFVIFVLANLSTHNAQALPEYSAQVGEPCSSCHISPSGGGPRGPRGQAWVGSEKPGYVPSLLESLDILGVNLEVDPDQFIAPLPPFAPADPLMIEIPASEDLFPFLFAYEGN